jgi:hypothetical protein
MALKAVARYLVELLPLPTLPVGGAAEAHGVSRIGRRRDGVSVKFRRLCDHEAALGGVGTWYVARKVTKSTFALGGTRFRISRFHHSVRSRNVYCRGPVSAEVRRLPLVLSAASLQRLRNKALCATRRKLPPILLGFSFAFAFVLGALCVRQRKLRCLPWQENALTLAEIKNSHARQDPLTRPYPGTRKPLRVLA